MHTHLSRVLLATSLAAFLALGAPAFAQSHADDPTSTQTAAKPATKTAAETATESAGDTTADPAAERPLIERSLLLVPAQAGDFELRRLADYPGQPAMGAGVRYVHPDFPELALDVFIYPLGDFTRTTMRSHRSCRPWKSATPAAAPTARSSWTPTSTSKPARSCWPRR